MVRQAAYPETVEPEAAFVWTGAVGNRHVTNTHTHTINLGLQAPHT